MKPIQLACLIVGCFSAFCANSPKLYSTMKAEWKHDFEVEPTKWGAAEIGNVYALSSLGFFIVPCGLIYDSLGTFGVLLYGTVLTAGGFGGISALYNPAYNYPPWVYGLLYALTIQGGCALNFGAIWTNSKVFPATQAGMVTGVLLGVYSCGAFFMVELYKRMFLTPSNVGGYIGTWAGIVFAIGCFVTLVLPVLYNMHVKQVAREAEEEGDRDRAESISQLAKPKNVQVAAPVTQAPPTPIGVIFKDIRFWMICSIYCFCTALGMAWGGNIRSILSAYWYGKYIGNETDAAKAADIMTQLGADTAGMVKVFVFAELCARLGVGIISDLIQKWVSRLQVICFLCFLMVVSVLGQVALGEPFTMYMIFAMGIGYAGLYSVIPPYLRSTFDVRRFGLITGMGYSFMIPGNMVFCNIFAYFSDMVKASSPKSFSSECVGDACFRNSFIIGGIGCCIPFVFTLIMSFYDNSVAEYNANLKAAMEPMLNSGKDDAEDRRRVSSLAVPDYHPSLKNQEEFQKAANNGNRVAATGKAR